MTPISQMLKDTQVSPEFSMGALAELTEGYSGSDLREMCRNAAMVPVREYVRSTADNQELLEKGQLEVIAIQGSLLSLIDITQYRVLYFDL